MPEPAVGPQVAAEAKEAGIPLPSSDEQVCVSGPKPPDRAKARRRRSPLPKGGAARPRGPPFRR
ncbi:hypothetical protein K7B10_04850 [Streptomyces flavotricini]|uniref:Uncharacterized protein n=1 Tax=Streptomyces flavotricini TaxID=66888 RepID=A0ABS8DZQ0_9ACTN|nr:hypothetical protein [Streptomyces flavotricini]MCC0094129.1 hypothetical protein [Streptomyces flavotricini]